MNAPRLSIIPARAATDPALKPRDLQVLCVLGRHTDELGWCRRSQVRMAREMGCARSTVQSAIGRLVRQGYLEQYVQESESGRDGAHLYRVILDPVHAALDTVQGDETDEPEEADVCETSSKLACLSVGTPAGIPAPPAGPESAPPAGPGPAPMLTTPINDPLINEREGACGREQKKDDPTSVKHLPAAKANRVFNALVEGWPGNKAASLEAARREFNRLTPDEQQDAADKRDDWVAFRKSQGRTMVEAPSKYLAEKLWKQVPVAFAGGVKADKPIVAAKFGKMWNAVRFSELLKPPKPFDQRLTALQEDWIAKGMESRQSLLLKRQAERGWETVNSMHEAAIRRHRDWRGDATLEPLLPTFVQVHKGSDIWLAWKQLHTDRGWPWFGEDRDCPPFVWMPAPPGDPPDYPTPEDAVRAAMAGFETEHAALTQKDAAE